MMGTRSQSQGNPQNTVSVKIRYQSQYRVTATIDESALRARTRPVLHPIRIRNIARLGLRLGLGLVSRLGLGLRLRLGLGLGLGLGLRLESGLGLGLRLRLRLGLEHFF